MVRSERGCSPVCGRRAEPCCSWRTQIEGKSYPFPVFELILKQRRRSWRWSVCTAGGDIVMQGRENSRPAARYTAERALFLLLLSAALSPRCRKLAEE